MPDKQPSFTVTFKELAISAIKRQARGEVILVLDSETDQTSDQGLNEVSTDDFTPENYLTLELCFMGNPKKVTVLKKEEEILNLTNKLDKYNNYILIYPDAIESEAVAIKNYINSKREKNNYSIAIFANMEGMD